MVAMDTKFWRMYCAISDVRNFLYFQNQLPQTFTNGNETYDILRSSWGSTKMSQNFKILLLNL